MKKIIKRFWGVALVVTLLSTLLVGAIPQASAGNLDWGYATLPGGTLGPLLATNADSITNPGYVIKDIAVASNGQTIYAATSPWGGFASYDQGRNWSILLTGTGYGGLASCDRVAVAPDDPNIVAFLDVANQQFAVSKAGGFYTTLHVADVEDGAGVQAVTVTDIDIAPQAVIHGQVVHLILVTGTTASGPALFYLNYGVEFATWDECLSSTAFPTFDDHAASVATTYNTVKASPNFSRDFVAYLVGNNGTRTIMDVVSFNSNQFNSGIPSYQYYADAGLVLDANAALTAIVRADIVFDPGFLAGDEATRYTYISTTYTTVGGYSGGFYRVTDDAGAINSGNIAPGALAGSPASIWSIDISADGTTLVAADGYASTTWTITNPKYPIAAFIAFTPSRTVKRSGGGGTEGFSTTSDHQTIAYADGSVVMARAGTQGAFSLSRDNGYTFNDISMVNTYIDDIDDHVVNANGVERYVVSYDYNNVAISVWYWDGKYWERVLVVHTSNYMLANASPNNFNVLYIADKSTALLRYTATAGRVNWLERSCPNPFTSALTDFEVQDDTTLWLATTVGTDGIVTKVTETGNIWPVSGPYYNAIFSNYFISETIASLTLISPDNLVVGGATGYVAYTNGGLFFTVITTACGSGSVHATASSTAAGGIVYATPRTTDKIYYWVIGSSLNWSLVSNATSAVSGQYSTDLAIYNGAMYFTSTNGSISYLGRALMPALNLSSSRWVFNQIVYDPFGIAYDVVGATWTPDVLKFSADAELGYGNKIWITDSAGGPYPYLHGYDQDQIMCFTDTLVSAVPELYAPKDGVLVEVNRETGIAYNTTLSWKSTSGLYWLETYELQIAYDSAFTRLYSDTTGIYTAKAISSYIVGPINITASNYIEVMYQPGETFYWRVRTTGPYYSGWSATWTINVQPIRNTIPELYSPANGGDVAYLKPGFSWTPMGAYVEQFHFQIAEDYAFTKIVEDALIDADGVDGAGYGLTKNLVDGKQYFWHVQVSKPFAGDWSTVANFWVKLPKASTPIVITQTNVTLTATQPAATSVTVTAPVQTTETAQAYVWAIIIIGAVLVIAVIVLIFRTRKV